MRLDFNIGCDAAAVPHGAPEGGFELVSQRVGNMPHAAVFVAVRIIYRLYAAAAGRIVFGRGELQLATVRQRPQTLHQTLAKCASAYDYSPVHVLESPGYDFRGRSRAGIDHDDEGQFRIQRSLGRAGGIRRALLAPFGGYHKRALGHKERNYIHRLVKKSAAVTPQVEYKSIELGAFLQSDNGLAQLFSHALGKTGLKDVAGVGSNHSDILEVRQMYGLTGDAYIFNLSAIDLLHFEEHFGSGCAAHLLAALCARETLDAQSVNGEDLIAATQAGLVRRRVLIRLVDDYVPLQVGLVDDSAYAPVALVYHHAEVLVFLFGDIYRIWVKVGKHGVNSSPLDAVERQRIHIRAVELLEYRSLDFGPFAQFETFGLRSGRQGDGRQSYDYQKSLHKCKINNYSLSCNHRAISLRALPLCEMAFLTSSGSSATLTPGYSSAMNTGS